MNYRDQDKQWFEREVQDPRIVRELDAISRDVKEVLSEPMNRRTGDRYVIFPPAQEPGSISVTINPLECVLMAEHSARIEAERKLAEWKVAESECKAMQAAMVAKRKAQRLKIVNCGRAMLVYFSILALAVLLALLIVRVA